MDDRRIDLIAAPLVAAYFGTLDIWGTEWDFVKNNAATHFVVFCCLLGFGTIVAVVRGIKAWFPDSTSQYIDSLEALLEGVSRIISAKTKRFRSKCSAITAYGDAFELITQPTEQIAIIIDEAHRFFPTRIGADKDQLDITVLHETSPGEWDFLATSNHTWTRVSPNSIMEGPSLAKKCLTSGECCFIPDKRLASEQGCYILSDRDRSHNGELSVFGHIFHVRSTNLRSRRQGNGQ